MIPDDPNGASTAQGQFVDAPVEGVNYESGSQSGVTDPNGEFTYEVGNSVRLSIGDIELGETTGKAIVTLLDLVSDGFEMNEDAINMGRFLQALDSDLSDDRITIPQAVRQRTRDQENRDYIQDLDFSDPDSFEANATRLLKRLATGVAQYTAVVNLVGREAAKEHMERSLNGLGIAFDPGEERPQIESALRRFASQAELSQYLRNGLQKAGQARLHWRVGSPVADWANAQLEMDTAGASYSTTNVQEVGVDEADTVETDGQYLYIAPVPYNDIYRYLEVVDSSAVPGEEDPGTAPHIRIVRLLPDTANYEEAGTISLDDLQNPVEGLYLIHDREAGEPDLLVTVGGGAYGGYNVWYDPWHWQNRLTEVAIFDVSDPSEPDLLHHMEIDGKMISTRRVEQTLYVITRYTPDPVGFIVHPSTLAEEVSNEAVLEGLTASDILPEVRLNGEEGRVMVRAESSFLPPLSQDREEAPNLITVTAIDLNEPDNPVSSSIAGPSDTVYMATNAMYVATTRYAYLGPEETLTDEALTSGIARMPPETTEIHKFDLTPAGPLYRASGEVVGNLGWESDKRPFRMSHYQDVLRVATSLGDTWNATSTTRLTLLGEDPASEGLLRELSHIDNIGEVGERLYASRFMGDRCYLVTFRVTDPLYIFDLSDPENPQLLGELHIDGYSDYLHPISPDLLLGIGKDAVPDVGSDDFGGRGAWYQGVKLSLFNIADPASPTEVDSMVIGKRGTESDALWDHHAIAYVPPDGANPARLALPVRLHDTMPTWVPDVDPLPPWQHYDWTHTGLYQFEIDPGETPDQAGLSKVGQIIAEEGSGYYYWWGGTTDRSVIVDDSVYYIHWGEVLTGIWGQ